MLFYLSIGRLLSKWISQLKCRKLEIYYSHERKTNRNICKKLHSHRYNVRELCNRQKLSGENFFDRYHLRHYIPWQRLEKEVYTLFYTLSLSALVRLRGNMKYFNTPTVFILLVLEASSSVYLLSCLLSAILRRTHKCYSTLADLRARQFTATFPNWHFKE